MKTIKLKKPNLPFSEAVVDYHNNMKSFNPKDLTLHLEPEQKEGSGVYPKGTVLAKRLKERACNASVLDHLIEHPELWPEEWKGKYVYFWGTIFRDPSNGFLYVRYGYWDGGEVVSNYRWLGNGWGSSRPAASLASLSSDLGNSESLDPLDLALRIKNLPPVLTINISGKAEELIIKRDVLDLLK